MNVTQKQGNALRALSRALHSLPPERRALALAKIERAAIDGAAIAEDVESMTNNTDPTQDPDLRLYPLAVISKHYNVSVRTLLRKIKSGELRAVRMGKGYSVTAADLKAWIEVVRFHRVDSMFAQDTKKPLA